MGVPGVVETLFAVPAGFQAHAVLTPRTTTAERQIQVLEALLTSYG